MLCIIAVSWMVRARGEVGSVKQPVVLPQGWFIFLIGPVKERF